MSEDKSLFCVQRILISTKDKIQFFRLPDEKNISQTLKRIIDEYGKLKEVSK